MLYLATANGLVVASRADDWQVVRRGLEGRSVTSVIAREGVILAGTTDGIYCSEDDGRSWFETSVGLNHRHIRWLANHPDISDFELAGTEPAGIFISRDGARTWRGAAEVARLRDHFHWFLPYSPQAGCVRGFAAHGARLYAAVEVGGVLRSDDSGLTWQLAAGSDGSPNLQHPPEPAIHADLHSILVHPSSTDLVFAPTGGGFYRSTDGGATWRFLYNCYCRAAWVDPADPAHILLGPADNVDANGRIEESRDGGETWIAASNGLDVLWRSHMVERFVPWGDELWAVLSNGQLIAAPFASLQWREVLPEVPDIRAIAWQA